MSMVSLLPASVEFLSHLPNSLLLALLPVRVLFSLNIDTSSLWGIKSGNVHHDPRTVAARVDSSERECHSLDTVSPPCENACSTSVEVANNMSDMIVNQYRVVAAYLELTKSRGPCKQVDVQLLPLLTTKKWGWCSLQLGRCSSIPPVRRQQWICRPMSQRNAPRNLIPPSVAVRYYITGYHRATHSGCCRCSSHRAAGFICLPCGSGEIFCSLYPISQPPCPCKVCCLVPRVKN